MARQDIQRQKELEPKRIEFAKTQLQKLGIEKFEENKTSLKFIFKDIVITLYPYSGYFSGKGIQPGRGITELLSKLRAL
jgi:hypothetical protein